MTAVNIMLPVKQSVASLTTNQYRKKSRKLNRVTEIYAALIKTGMFFLIAFMAFMPVFTACASSIPLLITEAETQYNIPKGLLLAIAKAESGLQPYAINIKGKSIIAGTKEEAWQIIRFYLERRHINIDVGVMQINFYWHGKHFNSINEMLTPEYNIQYAALFLNKLYKQYGSWNKAVRYYHSANIEKHSIYARKVLISWLGNQNKR